MRTRVGYAGGTEENPTYYQLGNHTETLQLDYDPALVSYAELLEIFWDAHDPFRQGFSRQYMNIVFVHDGEQERLARESKARLEAEQQRRVVTEIVPLSRFYAAEDYHQKYYLQGLTFLMQEFRAFYPHFQDFVNSPAAARVNGYAGGYGDAASLSEELDELGLSASGARILQRLVNR